MKQTAFLAALTLLCISCPASAREHFQVYEGRDSIREGQGGTRVTKNGIDYWATGTPPHRYQVIGLLIDKRGMAKLAGDPVGSPSVAQATKEAGGDAVIFLGEQDRIQGSVGSSYATGFGHSASAFGWAAPFGDRETSNLVVKYLPDEQSADPHPQSEGPPSTISVRSR